MHHIADQFDNCGLRRRRLALCRAQPVKLSYRLVFLTVERPLKLRRVAALQGDATLLSNTSDRMHLESLWIQVP